MLFSQEKEGNPAICNNMDGTWQFFIVNGNKQDREKQILHDITYMRNVKQNSQKLREEWLLRGVEGWEK